jgi:hypothetical protein
MTELNERRDEISKISEILPTEEELLKTLEAFSFWDGEDVKALHLPFETANALAESSLDYPPRHRWLLAQIAHTVSTVFDKYKAPPMRFSHPVLAAFAPIISDRNGGILWFNPETNAVRIT